LVVTANIAEEDQTEAEIVGEIIAMSEALRIMSTVAQMLPARERRNWAKPESDALIGNPISESVRGYLDRHAITRRGAVPRKDGKMGPMGHCFGNARKIARRTPHYIYCEGLVNGPRGMAKGRN
jgi:hypothetical protein